jgi:hypothetical protein
VTTPDATRKYVGGRKLPGNILPDLYNLNYTLKAEKEIFGDIETMPIPTGRILFGGRGIYQFQWALRNYDFQYYMRVDDDSFPCIPKILYEMQFRPADKFLWVKYWHQPRRTRIDENFMVLSRDLVEYIAIGVANNFLPFDPHVDFGINFTFWAQILNITIYDDVHRLDSHQSLLTKFMHHTPPKHPTPDFIKNVSQFCVNYIYAHHVSPGMMDLTHKMTPPSLNLTAECVPKMTRPTDFLYNVDTDFYSNSFPACDCRTLPSLTGSNTRKKNAI